MSSEPLNNRLRNIILFKYQLINMKPLKNNIKSLGKFFRITKIIKEISSRKENNGIL